MDVTRAIVVAGIAAGCLGHAGTAAALTTLTVDKCLASQIKIVGKGTAALVDCYAKGASTDLPAAATCLGKAMSKIDPALDKIETKLACIVEGSGATRASDAAAFAAEVDGAVGHAEKCDAAKTKLVGKYVAAVTGCYAKASGKTGSVDPACLGKAITKLGDGIAKAEERTDCTHPGQAAFLLNAAGAFAEAQTCAFDPSNPQCATCGNGFSDPGEACDASASAALWNQCGADFGCVACNCACPTTVVFSPDPTAPGTILDRGWTGIAHRAPVVGNGDVTMQLACTATSRPCGVCPVSGPVPNPQAGSGQLDNRRCTTDASKPCAADAVCAARTCLGGTNDGAACAGDSACPGGACPVAGTCDFYFGSAQPLAAGGVATCVLHQFAGAVTGTVNVESGEASTTALLTSRVYAGIAIDHPCPRCTDAGGINDGARGGTCDGGARVGLPCDANGTVPGRPDFGRTSLDCPPIPGALLTTLPIDLSNATDTVVKTLTVDSPNCSGALGGRCLCDTCNNAGAEPCAANTDCPPSGGNPGVCGGRRCLGGPNDGAPCAGNSACPASICSRLGEPTKPSSCIEDYTPDGMATCLDENGDGQGKCAEGPIDQTCSLGSGHAQRVCLMDADCGGGAGSCESAVRRCFLTGGGTFQGSGYEGTDTLVAAGMADLPVRDASAPTIASVFCVGPTSSAAVNNVVGLPGPGRLTIQGHAAAHP
ncbi:MAG: hypothetical protein IT293_14865 [Deltaproteobacteria bacterium]|nr:hypothetical protein [Deltaproteobacteria bacterium]